MCFSLVHVIIEWVDMLSSLSCIQNHERGPYEWGQLAARIHIHMLITTQELCS